VDTRLAAGRFPAAATHEAADNVNERAAVHLTDSSGFVSVAVRTSRTFRARMAPQEGVIMTRHQRVRYEMLIKVREFGRHHQGTFPETSPAGKAFAAVAAAAEEIAGQGAAMLLTKDAGKDTKTAVRDEIPERLNGSARTARIVAGQKRVSAWPVSPRQHRSRSTSSAPRPSSAHIGARRRRAHHERTAALAADPQACGCDATTRHGIALTVGGGHSTARLPDPPALTSIWALPLIHRPDETWCLTNAGLLHGVSDG
jgi:hypothetical protein